MFNFKDISDEALARRIPGVMGTQQQLPLAAAGERRFLG